MICQTEIYVAQEAENIFKGAIEKYNVNLNKLIRYARYRNKATAINHYYHSAIMIALNHLIELSGKDFGRSLGLIHFFVLDEHPSNVGMM